MATESQRTPAQIDAVAQGLVWSGEQALQHGLVDRLGGVRDALASAAQRAKLPGIDSGELRIVYLERQPGRLQRLLDSLGGDVRQALAAQLNALLPAGLGTEAGREMQRDLVWLAEMTAQRAPYALVTHCLCDAP